MADAAAFKAHYLSITRYHLRISECFSALVRFEEFVSRYPGIDAIRFVPGSPNGFVASGTVVAWLGSPPTERVIGSWLVKEDGTGTVELGDHKFANMRGSDLSREMLRAWSQGIVGHALNSARKGDRNHAAK
jgi:hypothetical protein